MSCAFGVKMNPGIRSGNYFTLFMYQVSYMLKIV